MGRWIIPAHGDMTERQRLTWGGFIFLGVVVAGTLGYMWIEDLSALAALYETVITVSTVGFAEPQGGFSPGGQVFTIIVILFGVGSLFYVASAALEIFIEGFVGGRRRQRREERNITKLERHIILCGFGRVGTSVAARLASQKVDLVIVDLHENRIEGARARGLATVRGDATHEDVLSMAGLERAQALIACVESDSDNLAIVLSARAREPDLFILARASERDAERRLRLAGADRVITPQEVGAERLAALALHPNLTEFVDIAAEGAVVELQVEEVKVSAGSVLVGRSLAEARIRTAVGATILAVRHANGAVTTNPGPDTPIGPGDVLVAIGTGSQLAGLTEMVSDGA